MEDHMQQLLTWESVESSNIESLAHDANAMYVRFKGGAIYQYENVSRETYESVRDADSVGGAFHKLIKSNAAAYPFKKLSP
jgi:hypothetical protein